MKKIVGLIIGLVATLGFVGTAAADYPTGTPTVTTSSSRRDQHCIDDDRTRRLHASSGGEHARHCGNGRHVLGLAPAHGVATGSVHAEQGSRRAHCRHGHHMTRGCNPCCLPDPDSVSTP